MCLLYQDAPVIIIWFGAKLRICCEVGNGRLVTGIFGLIHTIKMINESRRWLDGI